MPGAVDERDTAEAYINLRGTSPSRTLTKAHILDAIARSNDEGATLDISNKNLVDVGEAGVEALAQVGRGEDVLDECRILRIALVGNSLSSLPMSFARLSRLRYLTLRSNSFSVFPEVLTNMPSLEILDFSHNRIRGLPTNPGTLVNLRVMSVSRNKIRKLPSYLSTFRNLTVLKVDRNPIEWPPPEVMESETELEDSNRMHQWVDKLKEYLRNHHVENGNANTISTSAMQGAGDTSLHSRSMSETESTQHSRTLSGVESIQHNRNESLDTQSSIYSDASYRNSLRSNKPDMPPPIDTEDVTPSTAGLATSPESYLPTPEDSLPSVDDATTEPTSNKHARNNSSFTPATEKRSPSPDKPNGRLAVQKSLPDLRFTNGKWHAPHTGGPTARGRVSPNKELQKTESNESFSSFADNLIATPSSSYETPVRSRPPRSRPGHDPLPSITEQKPPPMDVERNSYFRRLSMLPVSTISRTTPRALLSVVDSVRGILFAVSQIYQSLQLYTVHCIDERLSAVLMKVLDPACQYLQHLINALDNFDSMSKRGCPPPAVCRKVVECCRDNVAIFGRAVGVLALQLKVLASRDDVRYSRQMLLVIYGATAEISHAWLGMAPQLDAVEHLLRDDGVSPLSSPEMPTPTPSKTKPLKSHLVSQASSNRSYIPPIEEQPELPPQSASSTVSRPAALTRSQSENPQLVSAPPMKRPAHSEGRSRMNRRHAGSFSVKDVEIGRSLPSVDFPPPSGGVASGSATPTPRSLNGTPRGTVPSPGMASSPFSASSTPFSTPFNSHSHSRQNSGQNGVQNTPQLGASKIPDAPASSNAFVDREAMEAMAGAVKAAPTVWSMLEEVASDLIGTPHDLTLSLAKAQTITRRLSDNIRAVQEGVSNADKRALREDAHAFIKTVVSLSKIVKEFGLAQRLSPQLRSDIAKLTNATQEFAMLLHVSSFTASHPRSFSPLVTNQPPLPSTPIPSGSPLSQSTISVVPPSANSQTPSFADAGAADEKSLLGAAPTLGRSRSAQPSPSSKLVPAGSSNPVPRSANAQQQAFKFGGMPPRPNGTAHLQPS